MDQCFNSSRGCIEVYWYSDDRSIQFNVNRQKSGWNRAFYGHWSSPVFLTNILNYRLDCQLQLGQLKNMY